MIDDLRARRTDRAAAIVTDRSAPTSGPVAFALACGAPLAVDQGAVWNDLAGLTGAEPRARLAELWDVCSPAGWRRTMDGLLAERGTGPNDLAMELRWRATVVRTVPPDLAGWLRIIREAAEYGQIGEHGVPKLLAAATRISRCEDRFRADGLIPPHGVVHSLRAHDWAHAVNVACLGLRAGYCDEAGAERAVRRAGQLCARHYMSWADLSAAFGLGRLLSFDDRDFPVRYADIRDIRRRLLTEDPSPWRVMSWSQAAGQN